MANTADRVTRVAADLMDSAAAVNAAYVDVTAFTAGLAARVGERASGVVEADLSYLFQEAASTATVAAVFQPMISE